MSEIYEKTEYGTFKMYKHHGSGRINSAKKLGQFDIALTTYGTLSSECPINEEDIIKLKKKKRAKLSVTGENDLPVDCSSSDDEQYMQGVNTLFDVEWHRVILDEAHIIKNKVTKASIAVQRLKSTYRWCLTGTPIQNSITDLFGLIRFLNIRPYNNWVHFQNHITKPFSSGRKKAVVTKVKLVLEALCLRRTKEYVLDGKPILTLLPKKVESLKSHFTAPENDFYQALFTKARIQFNIYLKQGTVMKNYSHVLAWLLRLRQAWY